MVDLGDVVVVAPDSHQSGMGHAITISNILRMTPHDFGMSRASMRTKPAARLWIA